ncbi:MAG: tRNA epoxyqueuosine(34) reductase QueG [Gammaproteobacteria bacterium]|nr:tRNA epoxyqueuosine(34) reductase QueG [Gammaproteobacteria bacterium]MBU2676957.1 tRNA epoxyqueuosine(34) reductase QueG [Gammaproteobacteria bacterium]NNC56774.1 tRNA epoxyqueuosine(34) reductase QueG [Woeseiaceae bacterium]NNL50690.1 tRNA epoxyqueuosine(34) reductase QueG [Woeseiaceae bacterium]
MAALKAEIVGWCAELGFQQTGISDINLDEAEDRLGDWLAKRFHGTMDYMQRHGVKRSRPDELVPGTVRVISVRMDYLPDHQDTATRLLDDESRAYVSRYALGRDYHKVLRGRLRTVARRIEERIGEFGYRVFVDSAPVMEKALAEKAGLGWVGKHTNLINRDHGSWFFLGELYTDLPLPVDQAEQSHCGTCAACIEVCPTDAIVAPYSLDARRCISYLTIELKEAIPIEFRKAIGNRIYGCDDCQLFCPWNKFAKPTAEADFAPRHGLDAAELAELFAWDEETWLKKTEGSAIRRIGFERWLRNIATALGNAKTTPAVVGALKARQHNASEMVAEHVNWALAQHKLKDNLETNDV